MKKKLTVNALAMSSIRTRKKQYLLMITGVIFAMIFSSAILFFASSMSSSSKEMARVDYGDCDAILTDCDTQFIDESKNVGLIDNYGYAHIIGFAESEKSEENMGTAVGYLDDKAMELSYIKFVEGSYPQNEGEIALEQSVFSRLRISDAKIGDTITLNFYNQNGTELQKESVEKSFKLVGIVKNKLTNILESQSEPQNYFKLIPSAFVYQGANTDVGGKENLCAYIRYNDDFTYKGEKDSWTARYSYFEDMKLSYESVIDIYQNSYAFMDSEGYTTVVLAIVLVVVLLIASAMGIINSFNSNLKDRKKQIGLFRTVGATKRQIVLIYGREAFIISLIAAPISVVISYFLVKFATDMLGENFIFRPNISVLVLSGVLGIIFVMLAALIPLLSASRISPMQSIRNIDLTRKMKTKKIKSKKSFNTPSLLAKRSLVFHSGKRVIVSILLVVTIILSCYGFSYLNYSLDDYYKESYDYEVSSSGETGYSQLCNTEGSGSLSENQKRDILLSPYVESVNGSKNCTAIINTDGFDDYEKIIASYFGWEIFESEYWDKDGNPVGEVTKDNYDSIFLSKRGENYTKLQQQYSMPEDFYNIDLIGADSSIIEQLKNSVVDGQINIDKINSGQEVILLAPKKIALEFESLKEGGYTSDADTDDEIDSKKDYIKIGECPYKAGDVLDLSLITGKRTDNEEEYSFEFTDKDDYKVKIGAIITEMPDGASSNFRFYGGVALLTTTNGINKFYPDLKYNSFNVYLKGECTDEIDEEMTSMLENIVLATGENPYVYSQYGVAKDNEQTQQILFISMLAIIILFLSISASIINNSFSSQIREGKREIGTLRAVGASQREIVISYIKQLISIFGWGYGIGFAGFGISYGIIYFISFMRAKEFEYEFNGIGLNISLWQTILACVILFAVCSINLSIKIRKEMKNSIIENIREL